MAKERREEDSWTHEKSTCQCVRCRGFQKGHTLNVGSARPDKMIHGAFLSPLRLRPEAELIADQIRPLLPAPHPSFEGTLQSYCISLARIQRAYDALEKLEEELEQDPDFVPKFNPISLGDYLMRWKADARKDAVELGLTPQSAAKIYKDAGIGNLAAAMTLTRDKAKNVPAPALEKMRSAMLEALADEDVIDAEVV